MHWDAGIASLRGHVLPHVHAKQAQCPLACLGLSNPNENSAACWCDGERLGACLLFTRNRNFVMIGPLDSVSSFEANLSRRDEEDSFHGVPRPTLLQVI